MREKLPVAGRVEKVIFCTSLLPPPPATKVVTLAVQVVGRADQEACRAAGVVVPTANFTVFDE